MTEERYFTIEDLAYLAGIIDGEGCIAVSKQWRNNRWQYRLQLSITSTSEILKDWLETTFGGFVWSTNPRSSNRSTMLHWTASGNRCQQLLKMVLPYLKVKKPQAELALLMNFNPYGGASRWYSTYTEEEELLREKVRLAIHDCNSSGGNKGSYHWDKISAGGQS